MWFVRSLSLVRSLSFSSPFVGSLEDLKVGRLFLLPARLFLFVVVVVVWGSVEILDIS